MGQQMVYLPEPITEKDVDDGGSIDKCGSRYGVCGMQGWRRNMEDSHLTLPEFDQQIGLFAVFDGHGGRGVARYAAKKLPELLRATDAYKSADYSTALEQAFLSIDEKLREPEGRKEVAELDQADPGAPSRPIAVPRAMLKNILRSNGRKEEPVKEEEPAEAKEASPAAAPDSRTTQKGWGIRRGPVQKPAAANRPVQAEDEKENSGTSTIASDAKLQVCATEAAGSKLGKAQQDGGAEPQASASASAEEPEEEMAMVDPSRLMKNATPEGQGCTAVVVLVVHDEAGGEGRRVYCANAGDSRAIMSRLGTAVALSEDQKPENPSETARIEKAGGYVKQMPAGGARVQGDLNLSRAMGDLRHKKPDHLPPAEQILTVFPEVRCVPLTGEHEFLVLGCDGIWERSTSQQMVDFVRGRLADAPAADDAPTLPLSTICGEACDKGLCASMAESMDGLGADNMTMMIVQLARPAAAKRSAAEVAAGEAPAAKARKVDD